jgi:hypothetical protein
MKRFRYTMRVTYLCNTICTTKKHYKIGSTGVYVATITRELHAHVFSAFNFQCVSLRNVSMSYVENGAESGKVLVTFYVANNQPYHLLPYSRDLLNRSIEPDRELIVCKTLNIHLLGSVFKWKLKNLLSSVTVFHAIYQISTTNRF